MTSKAFAPANISCIFRIYEHKDPRWMGSYGLGFTLDEGAVVSAHNTKKNEILFNNRPINFPTVSNVIKKLTNKKVKVHIKTKLPLGCGFGLSGASALAAAYSINQIFNLKKSGKELAIAAHTAEVESKTGLGDVVNQYYGGFCLKLRPSSHFMVKKLPISDEDVYCRHFSRLSTKSIITNPKIKNRINEAASNAMKKIKKNSGFGGIIKISRDFALDSGLLRDKQTLAAIKSIEINNGNASMIMLGNAVFSDKYFEGATKYRISYKGAHLL